MKKCSKCFILKPFSEFHKNRKVKSGITSTCKICQNEKQNSWRKKHSNILAKRRRDEYQKTKGLIIKNREQKRKERVPLKYRCQQLRNGMRNRSNHSDIKFDSDFFTVEYLISRLSKNSNCECCDKKLDIDFRKNKIVDNSPSVDKVDPKKGYTKNNVAIICWRCNRQKTDATPNELRMIADYIEKFKKEVIKDPRIPVDNSLA